MKKILLLLTLLVSFISADELKLKSGWNLVGINAPLTLTELQNQIGVTNLLVIQGPQKTYQKSYVDEGKSFLNDFEAFERGKGYWVKINNDSTLNYTPSNNTESSYTLTLQQGWNLIQSPIALTLNEIISQVGSDNLLVIQGSTQTYQKAYKDGGYGYLNDFETFNLQSGYWIKVATTTTLEFIFNIDKIAVNNSGQALFGSMDFNGSNYTFKVFTNTEPTNMVSQSTIALVGTINGINSASMFKLNSNYTLGSSFVVKVFNAQNEEIAKSDRVKYQTSPINFGTLSFSAPLGYNIEDPASNDANYQGLRVFAQPLTYDDYGLTSITDSDFNNLSPENQRIVANKLLALLFYGMSKTDLDTLIASGTFISTIQTKLQTPNSDLTSTETLIEKKSYSWSKSNANREKILARLFDLGLGEHYLKRWAAYILSQSIMFSPANELETVQDSDILNVYNRLVLFMDDDYSMKMITYLHMTSDDNWKRFRSPEDNGREMLEIFLLDFNDSHVPSAGIALKNWRLDPSDLELIIGLNQNDQPQNLFGTTVTTGFDFYRELVKSADFTNGVTTRLVNMYFSESTSQKKSEIISAIVNSKPSRFEDILLQIVFSKEFLYNTSRVKSIEEASFSLGKRIHFFDGLNFFYYLRESMDNMHQSLFNYKLGRDDVIPTDTLSFASYYDFMRRRLMIDRKSDSGNDWDSGWELSFIDKAISNTTTVRTFIDYLFLTVVDREPTVEERETLANYAINNAHGTYTDMNTYNDRTGVALIVMEYLSRLSEVYTFQAIEE